MTSSPSADEKRLFRQNYVPTEDDRERFNRYIQKQEGGCWEWIGSRDGDGYGLMTVGGRPYSFGARAHRLAWQFEHQQAIPPGLFVCHTCDNPPCVNPAHLWLGTNKENFHDSARKGRRKNVPHPPKRDSRGTKHGAAKLTDDAVRRIRSLEGKVRQIDLAREYGVHKALIWQVLRRKIWTHV